MEKDIHLIWRFSGLIRQTILSLIACGLLLGISWAGTGVSGPDLDRILTDIEARYSSLRTFTADFKQIQQSHLFHQAQVSEGMLFFDHTGKMLMHIIQPHAFTLLIAEDMMYLGDPATSAYTKMGIPARHSLLKGVLGLGQSLGVLKKQYDIVLEGDQNEGKVDLILNPRLKDRRMPFDVIRVRIDPQLWLPEIIQLKESNGDHTIIELYFITINEPLPDGIFARPASPAERHEK
jgi:outer membrane lipoprotein-sorting protein